MKLRIKGNSIRLRLTKTEVAQIQGGQPVQEVLSFSPTSSLRYSLDSSLKNPAIQAAFDGKTVQVLVPEKLLSEWANSESVSIQSEHSIDGGKSVSILIEKDFFCLKPRSNGVEDESDMFVNPNEAHGSCGW